MRDVSFRQFWQSALLSCAQHTVLWMNNIAHEAPRGMCNSSERGGLPVSFSEFISSVPLLACILKRISHAQKFSDSWWLDHAQPHSWTDT